MRPRNLCFPVFFLGIALSIPASRSQSWKTLASGTDTNLRGISSVMIPGSTHISIWASGSRGVVMRSADDGATWTRLSVPGGTDLDFRGVVAISDKVAYVMASGDGEKSRIYKTTDGGATWVLGYTDKAKSFFLDSIACLSGKKCIALGDPVSGKFVMLRTTDGDYWAELPLENLPVALAKEGAFAASNSNLLVLGENEFFVITGGFAARVLHTSDGGKSWSASVVPIASDNASSGIFSIARSSANHFVVVGGDYANSSIALRTAAVSSDPEKGWQSSAEAPRGYRSAVISINAETFLAIGPTGSDLSTDSGAHWQAIPNSPPLNALFALDRQHIYAAGPHGTVSQFVPAESQ